MTSDGLLLGMAKHDPLLLRHFTDAVPASPDCPHPAKDVQSVRKAVWSLTTTADALRRRAAVITEFRSRATTEA